MERAKPLADHVLNSIVATDAEKALATQLLAQTASTNDVDNQRSRTELAEIYRTVTQREQGRETLLPSDPDLARPIISGLETFAQQVGDQIESQLKTSRTSRNRWLAFSAIAMVVAFVVPTALLLSTSDLTSITGSSVGLASLTTAAGTVVAVLAFRVFQGLDETGRRLQEKKVSLAFLKAALDLSSLAPTASPVLDRSFDMFLRHYEGPHSPVTAADIWPKFGQ
ncbi:hypothetical protein [Phycicoccus jejuensis]|uniref:hypothetical protein n=1 Tax=Phycicoccus jejuensis TaxID=367299 RepID=UPI0012FADEFC|nr:hypothetical protein [Phycicoccus jejuensis]